MEKKPKYYTYFSRIWKKIFHNEEYQLSKLLSNWDKFAVSLFSFEFSTLVIQVVKFLVRNSIGWLFQNKFSYSIPYHDEKTSKICMLTKNTFLFVLLVIFLSIKSEVMSFRSLTLSSSASELSIVVSSYASSPRVLPSWARLMAIPIN